MTNVFCDNKSCKHNLFGEICKKESIRIVNTVHDYEEPTTYECQSEEVNELPL